MSAIHPSQLDFLAELDAPFNETRCVVVDVETTGLNLMQDHLISIGGCSRGERQDRFRRQFLCGAAAGGQGTSVLHGISTSVQLEGAPPADALLAFLDYLGKSPFIAFHVTFGETMIRRAVREYLGLSFRHPWVDLAYVMPGFIVL